MPLLNARDLTDLQWAVLEVLIPETLCRKDRCGRPWKDRRAVLKGILWILRTGAPWADVPDRYPSYQTCHRRFQQWVRSGVMKGVLEALALDLKTRGTLDVREAFIDGSFAPAKKGAEGWKDKARQGHENHGGCRPPRSAGRKRSGKRVTLFLNGLSQTGMRDMVVVAEFTEGIATTVQLTV